MTNKEVKKNVSFNLMALDEREVQKYWNFKRNNMISISLIFSSFVLLVLMDNSYFSILKSEILSAVNSLMLTLRPI